MNTIRTRRAIALAFALAALAVLLGCGSSATSGATAAKGAINSATSDPHVQADLNQAKALVTKCAVKGRTPLQQIHLVHVLFFERAHGKHAAEVTSTRAAVFGCMGVPEGQRDNFKNDSITAAEHQKPHVWTKAGVKEYALVTWPGILAKYQHTAVTGTASPSASAS
jgi:hypothetical protein